MNAHGQRFNLFRGRSPLIGNAPNYFTGSVFRVKQYPVRVDYIKRTVGIFVNVHAVNDIKKPARPPNKVAIISP